MTLRAITLSVIGLALALSVAACGNKHETVTEAETEGIYVDVGGLTYQVQVSRELNPRDIEDQGYLKGLPKGTPPLKPNESWFGVFLRVWNEEEEPTRAAEEFHVIDTQYEEGQPCEPAHGCYEPIALDTTVNTFAYTPTQVDPGEQYPPPSSVAWEGVIGGSLLLFRVPYDSYDNRPLELEMKSVLSSNEAVVKLDI